MYKFILLFAILITSFGFRFGSESNSLTGKWKLICFEDLLSKKSDCNPQKDKYDPILLEFKDDGINGLITGKNSVNRVQGKYTLSKNRNIKVEEFGGTKVMEHGWGSNFRSIIHKASSYKFSANRDTLYILYDGDKRGLVFVRE